MTTELKTKPAKIEDLTDLISRIQKSMEINKEGVVTVPADIYEQTLPESITPELVKHIQTHNADFMAASTAALGEIARVAMRKDKALERCSAAFKIGKDSFETTIQRSAEVKAGTGADSGTKTVYGFVTAKYKCNAGSTKRGSLKAVRAKIQDAFATEFGE